MSKPLRNRILTFTATLTAAAGLALSPLAVSHLDDKQIPQSYRQSFFTLVAMNFGPISDTSEGDIPYDQARMEGWASDLAALATLNVMRGFPDGSEKGTTRAKPEIWENKDDFAAKLKDFQTASMELQQAVKSGDRDAIGAAVGATGKTCKACHDEYKAKNYLY